LGEKSAPSVLTKLLLSTADDGRKRRVLVATGALCASRSRQLRAPLRK